MGTGEYKCEACGQRFEQLGSITHYHMQEWDVVGADGTVTKERLCRTRDSVKIKLLKARGKATVKQLQLSTVRSAATTHWALTEKNLETRIVF